MKTAVLLLDHVGYSERLRCLSDTGFPVFAVAAKEHAQSLPLTHHRIDIPEDWLPTSDKVNKFWFKADAIALAAIKQLTLQATFDFFWIVEYDCCATVDRWTRLFKDPVCQNDGVFLCPRTKAQTLWNPYWTHPGTDERATHMHIQAIYGLSKQAVDWCVADATSKRETFCEMCTASTIVANGGTIDRVNKNEGHCNSQTMKTDPNRVLVNRNFINHPIKSNTYSP